jgi:hypothetical protein
MSLDALKALRTRLSTNAALVAYYQSHYDKAAKHMIGYNRSPSANDFPSICYVQTKSRRKFNRDGVEAVSLVLGVNEPGITDDVFDGVTRLDEIEGLIMAALIPLKLDAAHTVAPDEITIVYDLGMRHPFHEKEIQLLIKSRS